MALDQMNLMGVQNAFGTPANIAAATGLYIPGRQYIETDTGFRTGTIIRFGEAVSSTVINWRVTQSQIDTLTQAIAAEETARISADNALGSRIDTEATARANADTALQIAITAEETARIAGDAAEATARTAAIAVEAAARLAQDNILLQQDINLSIRIGEEELARQVGDEDLQAQIDAMDTAYKAADATNLSTVNTSIAAVAAALRDERVTDFVGVDYTASQSMTVASLLGATPLEGIHLFKFNSTDISNTATVTGLPNAAANLNITYNDIVKVVVDGGVATSVSLVDDALKTKFDSVDSAIADLQSATTATAIRAHLSKSGFLTYSNGVFGAALSTEGGNDVILSPIDGNPYLSVGGTSIQYLDDTGTIGDSSVNVTVSDIYAKIANISSSLVQASNGLDISGGDVILGGPLTKNTTITGAFGLNLLTDAVRANSIDIACWTSLADGTRDTPSTTEFVKVWFDLQNGINYTRVTVPN